METTASLVIFYSLAIFMIVCSILAVTSTKILRAATYLLFVLIGSAGLYLLLNYHFIAAVQISVYAGGIVVLYVFAILLTSQKGDTIENNSKKRAIWAGLTVVAGIIVTAIVLLKQTFNVSNIAPEAEINMKAIGHGLMGMDKYQYLLPFEALSVLLLACIIGGILIARKR